MGSNLPSSVANGLKKVTASIDDSLDKIQDVNFECIMLVVRFKMH